MFDGPAPHPEPPKSPADFSAGPDAYWHLVHTLRLTLPPPLDDTPAALARRDHAAIARVAALAPAHAAEADLAAQFVAASEQWKDCLRLAQAPEITPDWAQKCRAQAIGMMRQANNALRLLLRMQAARRKLEADHAAADRLTWSEHCAAALMAEALSAAPQPPSGRSPDGAQRNPGSADAAEIPVSGRSDPGFRCAPSGLPVDADLIAAAERYAALYPARAATIQRTGKLPSDVIAFWPPEAALAPALIAAPTPALAALDRPFGGTA